MAVCTLRFAKIAKQIASLWKKGQHTFVAYRPDKIIRHMKKLYKEQLIKKILHIVEEEVREELKNENPETLYILGGIQMQITIGKAEERQKDERELHQNTIKVLKELISKINSINKNQ